MSMLKQEEIIRGVCGSLLKRECHQDIPQWSSALGEISLCLYVETRGNNPRRVWVSTEERISPRYSTVEQRARGDQSMSLC